DSDASREITTLAPLADQAGQIIAGNGAESWRFQLGASEWQATSFTAPANLLTLIGSAADAQVLYARSEQGFWRLDFRPPQRIEDQITYYLPLIQNGVVQPQTRSAVTAANDQCRSVTTDARSSDCATAAFAQTDLTVAELAVERANDYRTLVGVMPLHLHPSLIASAQNHTNYLVTNYTDPSAWTYGAHGEVQGLPFFTGQWPKDRIVVTGYPWWGGAEVIHGYGDPVASIDGWIATVYHRFPILEPYNHYAGYANHAGAPVQADILDFGAGPMSKGVWMPATPFPLAYPINGQIEIPTGWNGSELPNPLPPGTQGPVGYPFTLQAIGGKMRIMTAALRTESGEVVPTFPNPSDCAAGRCLALIAVEPLQPQVTYIASAAGDISGIPFASEWHFTTGAESMAVTAATALPAAGAPLAEVNQIPPPKQMNAELFSAQP
ncbi:MAG: hypothetical protein KDE19_08075, partial [Caldilineaceae bacterium]|nr:hypothetical protein [Caldilineaceae bacterium]